MELDGKVIVLKRIHVTHKLRLDADKRETAEHVHSFYVKGCPMARSVEAAIAITSSLELVENEPDAR